MKKSILILSLLTLVSCTKKEAASTAPASTEAAPQEQNIAKSLENTGTSTIEGVVQYLGDAPKPGKNPATAMKECQAPASDPNQWALRVKDQKLMNAFVYVKEGLPFDGYPAAAGAVELDQKGCAYIPRVLGVQVGQALSIHNSDPTLHNVHSMAKASPGFNAGMPKKDMSITKIFEKPEVMMMFKCDVHPWMRAYVGVVPHPFFAVTKEDGSFSIPNLPAGTFTLEIWHETLGTQPQTVTVTAGEKKTIDVSFPAKPAA